MRQIVNINQPSGSNHEGIMKTLEELKQESRFLVCLARNTALNCQYSSSGGEIIYTEWIKMGKTLQQLHSHVGKNG